MGVNASSDTAPKWKIFSDAFTAAANEEVDVAGDLTVTCAAALTLTPLVSSFAVILSNDVPHL
ncbi:hypothetical protein AXM55_23780 [Salmonella enterica subsp. enterica]|uniref:Uncharacterized protein n=1 Tax=Salmonella enterica subsp. enterica serovar Colindale TaxID=1967991 RepID=A0A5X5NRG1_SALET|nr:hypothetical protein [Salmonella enterica]EAW1407352.1 hypothetical protein [Salmonella enterica subsp. enterica]EBS2251573.1 hypothetical protein [Salmonella enterica subsp. enterica serovar Colindale]EBY6653116.1 hypothetical protein [Salmonella enterica subsp. enterica serovar Oranienburg]EBZ8637249.1 hypothetical protein [Salmonella enterica subsp. enterica serovar Strathcona]EDQ3451083.1 hypothetical protein [Salmonella enterica subsp. enterica serovar Larochelle]